MNDRASPPRPPLHARAHDDAEAAPQRLCRRAFLGVASGAALAALLAPALAGCEVGEVLGGGGPAPAGLDFDVASASFAPLTSVGGVVTVDAGPKRILLLRTSDAEVVAIDRICTHQGCDMDPAQAGRWSPASMELLCRCHNARFSSTGEVLAGPAQQALARHAVTFDAATGKGTVHFA